jgi:Fur family transcriptional regulator, peroxide stress response regulator
MKKGFTMKDPPNSPEDFEQTRVMFKEADLRITHQRLEIYTALKKSDQHPSADDIFVHLSGRMPTLFLDTVYRNLHALEEKGIIKRVFSIDDRARFDANLTLHHHLCCRKCKL